MSSFLNRVLSSKHTRFGIPFVGLILAGSFVFREFQQAARYDYRKTTKLSSEEVKKLYGVKFDEVDILKVTEEAQKLVQNDYQMVRGPRPWEEETIRINRERKEKAAEEMKKKGQQGVIA